MNGILKELKFKIAMAKNYTEDYVQDDNRSKSFYMNSMLERGDYWNKCLPGIYNIFVNHIKTDKSICDNSNPYYKYS